MKREIIITAQQPPRARQLLLLLHSAKMNPRRRRRQMKCPPRANRDCLFSGQLGHQNDAQPVGPTVNIEKRRSRSETSERPKGADQLSPAELARNLDEQASERAAP